jgi:hypothetical protein
MRKNIYCFILAISLLSIFTPNLSAQEYTKLLFLNKYIYSIENEGTTIKNSLIDSNKGNNYGLNFWGIGLKYNIIQNSDLELSFKSLLNHVIVGYNHYIDANNNIDNFINYDITSFNEISLGGRHAFPVSEKLDLIAGIDINYFSSCMLRDMTFSERRWASGFCYDLRAGLNYQFIKRANIGINVLYDTRKSIEFKEEGGYAPHNVVINVNPFAFEMVLTLDF